MNEKPSKDSLDNTASSSDSVQGPSRSFQISKESLDEFRAKKSSEGGKKRGRKPKSKQERPELTKAQIKQMMVPMFAFANGMLVKYKQEPLNPQEIDSGCEAWFPLLNYYLPMMDKYMMFIMPLMWTGGVVVARLPEKKYAKPSLEVVKDTGTVKTASDARNT